MSLMIGVISYLPNSPKVRDKRIKAVSKQMSWLHSVYPNHKVNVVAQNYHENELLDYPYINYDRYSEGIGAGPARNVILEKFYRSDCDFLLLCDDDSICYDYYEYKNFMHHIAEQPSDFNHIDSVIPVEPEYYPFKKSVYEDKYNLDYYKFKPRYINSGAAIIFLRNINKYYGKELYFNNIDANKGEGREDIDFTIRWIIEGFTCYEMSTWIKKSLCFNYSSIFGDDIKRRDSIIAQDLKEVVKQYSRYLHYKRQGVIDWASFNSVYNKSKPVLYIPRRDAIIIKEKEMPRYTTKNGFKSLF